MAILLEESAEHHHSKKNLRTVSLKSATKPRPVQVPQPDEDDFEEVNKLRDLAPPVLLLDDIELVQRDTLVVKQMQTSQT